MRRHAPATLPARPPARRVPPATLPRPPTSFCPSLSLPPAPQVEFNKAALSLADAFPADQKKAALNRLLKVGGAGGRARVAWQGPRHLPSGTPATTCTISLSLSLTRTHTHTARLQDNVALIAVLEALEPPFAEGSGGGGGSRRQLVCVANTHIHSNPELNDVKLWQVGARYRMVPYGTVSLPAPGWAAPAAPPRHGAGPLPSARGGEVWGCQRGFRPACCQAPSPPRVLAANQPMRGVPPPTPTPRTHPQVHTLLKGLEKIAASADIPMLVAGDFNTTPGSAAHAMLVKGAVAPSNPVSCFLRLGVRGRACVGVAGACGVCGCVWGGVGGAAGAVCVVWAGGGGGGLPRAPSWPCPCPRLLSPPPSHPLSSPHLPPVPTHPRPSPAPTPAPQELANDPLGILRPASKLQHQLPLASAYAAVAAAPDNDHGMQRQKRRLDGATGEPK